MLAREEAHPPGAEPSARAERVRVAALWVALGAALSPALVELGAHLQAEPRTRYVVVPFGLLLLALGSDLSKVRPRSSLPASGTVLGLALLAGGLLVELAGWVAGPPQLARLSLPLAVLGMACVTGVPRAKAALLALWLVPVPAAALRIPSPALESGLAQVAALPFTLLTDLRFDGRAFVAETGRLWLEPAYGGLPLAALFAAIAWAAAARQGRAWTQAIRATAIAGALAFPVQILGLAAGAGLLLLATPDAGRFWLDHGLWMFAAAGALVLAHRSTRRPP